MLFFYYLVISAVNQANTTNDILLITFKVVL